MRRFSDSPAAAGQTGFSRFLAIVLADERLQQRLRAIELPERLVADAVEAAAERGCRLDAADLHARLRPRLPGAGQSLAEEIAETPLPPPGWLPIDVVWKDSQPWLLWCDFDSRRLVEPFFEISVQQCQRKPFNRLFQCAMPIRRLPEWLRRHDCLSPRGLIFHMSRCGSTLVAQMLAVLPQNIVVSEAPAVDALVRAERQHPELPDGQAVLWLRALAAALGQRRFGDERHLFLKLDSWHTAALPLFRRAFPAAPWVFLYRDPIEVMVSQVRAPGSQMLPQGIGPALYGIERFYRPGAAEEYYARVLAKICEPILDCAADGGLLINYRQLPEAVAAAMLPHFGIVSSLDERAAMARAARWDAKVPGVEFSPDSADKQRAASDAARTAARRWLGDIYDGLEARRAAA